jgi:hypothetical protein
MASVEISSLNVAKIGLVNFITGEDMVQLTQTCKKSYKAADELLEIIIPETITVAKIEPCGHQGSRRRRGH